MIRVLFLFWISTRNAFSQNVAWTIGTPVPRYGEDLRLHCTVDSNCCTSRNRVWEIGSGTQILSSGTSSRPDKYVEDWNGTTSGFSLIIKNLDQDDVWKNYTCRYRLGSEEKNLTQDETWEFIPEEKCPVSYIPFKQTDHITYIIEKSAPSTSVVASFGDKNLTSGLTITGPTNFDTWFYSMKVSIDIKAYCDQNKDEQFALMDVTGTTTRMVCEKMHLCFPCLKCAGQCLGLASLGLFVGFVLLWFIYYTGFTCFTSYWKTTKYFCCKYKDETGGSTLYGIRYGKVRRNSALYIASLATIAGYFMLYCLIIAFFLIGLNCPSCKDNTKFAVLIFAVGALVFLFVFCAALKVFNEDGEETNVQQRLYPAGFVILSFLILPIPFLIGLYFCYCKEDTKDKRYLKQCLRFTGIVVLSFLIIPMIILSIIYFCCWKVKRVKAIIGRKERLPCPFNDASGQISWIKVNVNFRETYSEGTDINQDLPGNLRDRLDVDGRDLCISNVQESDAGIYECVFTPKPNKVPESSKLKLIVSAGKEKTPTPV